MYHVKKKNIDKTVFKTVPGVTKKRGTGLKKLPRAYLWTKIDQTFTQISPSTL